MYLEKELNNKNKKRKKRKLIQTKSEDLFILFHFIKIYIVF